MEKTIQKKVFDEIKQQTGIRYSDIAEKLSITKGAMTIRMQGSISLDNFMEMLKICGYEMVLTKAPEGRAGTINVGRVDCGNCFYKNCYTEVKQVFEKYNKLIENENTTEIK